MIFAAGSAARAGCRPLSLRVNVRFRSLFLGQRGASDGEDEDVHPERLSAQVRLNTPDTRPFVLFLKVTQLFPWHCNAV